MSRLASVVTPVFLGSTLHVGGVTASSRHDCWNLCILKTVYISFLSIDLYVNYFLFMF